MEALCPLQSLLLREFDDMCTAGKTSGNTKE